MLILDEELQENRIFDYNQRMMKHWFFLLSLLLLAKIEACSCFMMKQGPQVFAAKNYDWQVEEGMLVVNKAGIKKTAIIDPHPLTWTSRYGCLSFNQYGREFPMGGVNEEGLVVEILWLQNTKYPQVDGRKGLPELQWIQYQLDTSKNVEDVISSDSLVRLSSHSFSPVHFMVIDRQGEAATIEYLEGKMVVHRTPQMPVAAITNDTYEQSVRSLQGGMPECNSLMRFSTIAKLLPHSKACVGDAFHILKKAKCGKNTVWSIVYELKERKVHFLTASQSARKSVCLKAFDFSPSTPVLVLDLNQNISGDVTRHFIPYSKEFNRKLIDHTLDQTPFLKGLPAIFREELANYPDTTHSF